MNPEKKTWLQERSEWAEKTLREMPEQWLGPAARILLGKEKKKRG